jgi:hypothetical protein
VFANFDSNKTELEIFGTLDEAKEMIEDLTSK